MRDQRHASCSDEHDRREISHRIEGKIGNQRRIDGVRIEHDAERVTVGLGLGNAAVPIEPDAPPRLSTMNCCPVCKLSCCARTRATWSTDPPGGNTAIILTGLMGHPCGQTSGASKKMQAATKAESVTRSAFMNVA